MKTLDEIKRIKDYYVGQLYMGVRGEQGIDQSYIDDSFSVPEVKAPHAPLRSGIAYEVVSAPAEQIITSNPQAYFDIIKGDRSKGTKLSETVNQIWIETIRHENPNLFKELVKNLLSRGESYIKLVHNETWVTGKKNRIGLPVIFQAPESMAIYGSLEENDCGWIPNAGVPNCVVVFYDRQPVDVENHYPDWARPDKENRPKRPEGWAETNMVQWFEYWDKESRYFEADGVAVLKGGIQPNIYGFTPFVRKFSGFGKRSPSGELSSLIVSDIRHSRDLIKEECIIRSDISSIQHIFAHKPITIILPTGEEISEENIRRGLDFGSYSVNLLQLPTGSTINYGDTMLPSREMYLHLSEIRDQINQRYPFLTAGFPSGTSGRQQDMSGIAAMRRYDSIVENTELQMATAIEMALQMCRKVPKLKPDELTQNDLDVIFKCRVTLKASNPIEEDRLATLGSRLFAQSEIDLKTNLMQYKGYSEDEADKIIVKMLADKVTLFNPEVAEVMGMVFAEEAGMEKYLELARQRRESLQGQQLGLQKLPTQSEMTRTAGEVSTPMGREMIDESMRVKGARRPPQMYSRGK